MPRLGGLRTTSAQHQKELVRVSKHRQTIGLSWSPSGHSGWLGLEDSANDLLTYQIL